MGIVEAACLLVCKYGNLQQLACTQTNHVCHFGIGHRQTQFLTLGLDELILYIGLPGHVLQLVVFIFGRGGFLLGNFLPNLEFLEQRLVFLNADRRAVDFADCLFCLIQQAFTASEQVSNHEEEQGDGDCRNEQDALVSDFL